ncbi:MAG: DUF3427 domain-containing protein [Fibrobacterales bacterium]
MVHLLTFYYDIWQKKLSDAGFTSMREALKNRASLNTYPRFKQELQELLYALKERVDHIVQPLGDSRIAGLFVHGYYSREQLKSLTGLNTPEKASSWREGVVELKEQNSMLMLVTLNKSDKHFSATTSYEDYAISESLFHWQTQNVTRPESERGQKYINQMGDGRDMLLFVRDSHKDAFGLTDTYWFLGRVEYKAHRGSQPMSIEWLLENPIPPVLWQSAGKMAVG